jgi:hypothetical protein
MGQAFLQQSPAEDRGERFLVGRAADDGVDRARARQDPAAVLDHFFQRSDAPGI